MNELKPFYFWSFEENPEKWNNGPFDTVEEAYQDMLTDRYEEDSFFIGIATMQDVTSYASFDVDEILEAYGDSAAYDGFNPESMAILGATREQSDDLEERLANTMSGWMKENKFDKELGIGGAVKEYRVMTGKPVGQ